MGGSRRGAATTRDSLAPKVETHVVDFDRLDEAASRLRADAVFCALGTTMRAAGSRERFRQGR